jgi:TRAP transporter 4TM/12TM fusion protein
VWKNSLIKMISIVIVLVSVLFLTVLPINPHILRVVHLAAISIIIIITRPLALFKKAPRINTVIDAVLAVGLIVSSIYYCIDPSALIMRARIEPTSLDIIMGTIMILVTLEVTRRTVGNEIVYICIFFLLYGFFGDLIPNWTGHPYFDYGQVIGYLYGSEGIFGIPIQTAASFILLFVVFSAFLQQSGAAQAFVDLAIGLCDKMIGGAAKLCIVANTLLGMVSGSPIANVVTLGPFTVPMMMRSGMSGTVATAILSAASIGSQIMPPVMGAAAFIMVEYIGMPYMKLILIALIPALLYMISLFTAVDCEARKANLKPVYQGNAPDPVKVFKEKWNVFLSPIILLVLIIAFQSSLSRAVVIATIVCILMSWFKKDERIGPKEIVNAMTDGVKDMLQVTAVCASGGLIIGVFTLTGFGLKFSLMLMTASFGVLIIALLLVMVLVILLGLPLPPSASYLIPAVMIAPALINMGVNRVAAHMFLFYFSCFAPLSPPVALAAFTAAPFGKADPVKVGWVGARIALTGFLIPFVFVYQPEILFQGGTVLGCILAIASAVVGTWAFSGGINGYFFGNVSVLLRAILAAGGVCMITSGAATDVIGLGAIVGVIIYQRMSAKSKDKGLPSIT